MRQAIFTKYLSPTNYRGARIKATADAGNITTSWDYSLSVDENHTRAALALADKLGWQGNWVGGSLPGPGFAFVIR